MTMFFLTLRFVRRLTLGWLVIALASSGVWAQMDKANAASGRDYIVAVVDALPNTNHDVNVRAALLAQQLRQQCLMGFRRRARLQATDVGLGGNV